MCNTLDYFRKKYGNFVIDRMLVQVGFAVKQLIIYRDRKRKRNSKIKQKW